MASCCPSTTLVLACCCCCAGDVGCWGLLTAAAAATLFVVDELMVLSAPGVFFSKCTRRSVSHPGSYGCPEGARGRLSSAVPWRASWLRFNVPSRRVRVLRGRVPPPPPPPPFVRLAKDGARLTSIT